MSTLSENLKKIRATKKVKQTEMAELLSITTRNYQDYEYGKVDPPSSKLLKIADYLDVSVDYLLGRTDNPNSHK
ncbi:MAG: helix-turn-helix transcriptional regulator [Clostridia bacterium]|nr:helix-turn-helix transcriptional regulator [Clostridia bacterium]